MANLDTTINVKADSSGVSTGLEPGKRALKDFGKTADEAGKELSKIGDGGSQSAQKVEQATKSMVSSIQRTTALMDSGARGSVEYYKALANQRGIDANVLKPYLDQLDAVKVKQTQAAAAMLSGSQSLDKVGMSAAATANALRGVPAQFTDIVTSIQGGQAPLTVFLQQGGQLKDMFGGAGNAAKALGGYVLGLINPYTLVAAAVAGTAIAYEQGAAESRAFEKALILSGNQAGTTTGQMMAMAASIDRVSGTQGNAAEALAIFATNGKVASENLEQFTLTAIRFEKVTGTSIEDTAKKFAELKKAPLEATLKLNESMGYLTQGIYDQIKALTEQGRATEAASLAQSEFDKATAQMATDIERNLGLVQRSWNGVTGAVKEAWDAIKGIGRDAGLEGQVAAAQKMVDIRRQAAESIYGNAGDRVKLSEAENQLAGYQDLLKNQQLSAKYAAERSESVRQGAEWDKLGAKYLGDTVKMEREIAAAKELGIAAGKTGVELAQREADIRKSYEKKAGSPTAAREVVNKAAKDDIAAFKEMEKLRTKSQGDAMAAQEKFSKDLASEVEKTIEAYEKLSTAAAASAIANATAAEAELSNYGLLKSEVQALGLVQLEQARESSAMAGEDVSNIEKRIAAQKRLIAATKGVELRTSSDNAAKEAAAEWKRTADSIQSTLTDALMRGFESGKDFARNLRDTVVNMFKTMVLRPIISAVINPVAGALTGALGLSGAAQAASTGGSLLSGAGALAGGASAFGGAFGAGAALGTEAFGAGVSMMTNATGLTSFMSGAGQALGAIGPAGWAAIAALAVVALASGGETRSGASYVTGSDGKVSLEKGPSGGEIASTQARAMFDTAKTSIEGLLTGLGSKAVLTGYVAGLESSENGKGFAYAGGKINGVGFGESGGRDGGQFAMGDKSPEQAIKDYQLNLSQSILEGLQVTADIPASVAKLISDGLNGSEVKAMSADAVNAILANVAKLSTEVNTFNAAMTQLPFAALRDLSFDTAAGLIAAAGGFEKLDANLTSYYANFYTAEEQRAQSITNTEAAFAALGLTMPVLDEGARKVYRSMVEAAAGMDLSVEANAKAYAGLLALNPAMNALAPAFDVVATSAVEAAKAMTSAWATIMKSRGVDSSGFQAQAAIDAAFTEYKKTDRFGIASAKQFLTITQADFGNYTTAQQGLIATILDGYATISGAATTTGESLRTNAYAALERAVSAQRVGADLALSVAQEQVDAITSIFDTLKSNVQSLYGAVDSTAASQAAQGQAFINQALATAQASGYLPDGVALADAISASRSGIDSAVYASQQDADFARLELAGRLDQLKTISGDQLTGAEKAVKVAQGQLDALDAMLENAKLQLDSLNGISSMVLSIGEAMGAFDKAVADAKTSTSPTLTFGPSSSSSIAPNRVIDYSPIDAALSTLDFSGENKSAAAYSLYVASSNSGASQADIATRYGYTESDIKALFASAGIGSFAVGTNRVPYDQLAMIHEGEAIVPAAYNPANGGAVGNTARLESLIVELTAKVAALEGPANRTATAIEGNQSRPILVEIA